MFLQLWIFDIYLIKNMRKMWLLRFFGRKKICIVSAPYSCTKKGKNRVGGFPSPQCQSFSLWVSPWSFFINILKASTWENLFLHLLMQLHKNGQLKECRLIVSFPSSMPPNLHFRALVKALRQRQRFRGDASLWAAKLVSMEARF